MAKVTYLIGAGASAQVLPVVNDFSDRMNNCINFFASQENKLSNVEHFDNVKETKREIQDQIVVDLEWLQQISHPSVHASVDTAAKKFFIQGDQIALHKLKSSLSLFLTYEHMTRGYDLRYDSFLASILTSRMKFPSEINILSWNYDYQIELALAEYSGNSELRTNRVILGILDKNGFTRYEDLCNIVKLNGSVGFWVGDNFMYLQSTTNQTTHLKVKDYMSQWYWLMLSNRVNKSLSFAWEPISEHLNVIKKSQELVQDTEILVIIGYSMPFFNREVDRQIINSMGKLRKVYIQDKNPLAIATRFKSIDTRNLEVVQMEDVSQFFIPYEL